MSALPPTPPDPIPAAPTPPAPPPPLDSPGGFRFRWPTLPKLTLKTLLSLALLIALVISTALNVQCFLHQRRPYPPGPSPVYDRDFEEIGRKLGPELAHDYARVWAALAHDMEIGSPMSEAVGDAERNWKHIRTGRYDKEVKPALASIIPDGTPDERITVVQRESAVRAARGIAAGLNGGLIPEAAPAPPQEREPETPVVVPPLPPVARPQTAPAPKAAPVERKPTARIVDPDPQIVIPQSKPAPKPVEKRKPKVSDWEWRIAHDDPDTEAYGRFEDGEWVRYKTRPRARTVSSAVYQIPQPTWTTMPSYSMPVYGGPVMGGSCAGGFCPR